jgi:PhzF family phenazine biosynthesis protein
MDRDIATFVVDAFTTQPFAGNPAAVCLLDAPLTDASSLAIAREMNHSETAFVVPRRATGDYDLRWFTPKVEIDLCGHATLASAAVLFREKKIEAHTIRFHTRSGVLAATRDGDRIRLDFPANPSVPVPAPKDLVKAVGGTPKAVEHSPTTAKLLLEYAGPDEVRRLAPDFAAMLAARTDVKVQGVIATAKARAPHDFTSRYFAPWVGINEDPVTGSAHTVLAPYWARSLGTKEFLARQDSARGGELTVRLVGDRVHLIGDAVTVLRGTLRV